MKLENDLENDPIKSLVWRIAIPSMVAQFVSVLYSIVDRIYIGDIPLIGDTALAGVGVCAPVVTMISAFASLIGLGGSPLLSMRMGAKKEEEAQKILANSFLMICICSVFLMAVFFPLREPMLRLFGASDVTYPYADGYFWVYLCGTPFALLSVGLNQFIICQGFAKKGMLSVVLGAVMNIVLDPIFIFAFDMGVEGAALATVISQVVSCAYVLFVLFGKKVQVRITFGGYRFSVARQILALGFSPFLIIAIDNVMIIAMNAVLQYYGGGGLGDRLVVCATIAQSFMLIVTMPLGGISGGTQTILAYNYGARQHDRVRQAQKYILLLCLGFVTLMFVLSRLIGPLFTQLFTPDVSLQAEAFEAIKIFTLAILPLGIQYELVDGFTAMGQVKLSLFLSFFRKFVYFASLFIIPIFWGAKAAFFAEPVSDVLGPIVTIVVHRWAIRKILD